MQRASPLTTGLLILSTFIRPSRCRTSIKMSNAEVYNNFARYYKDSAYVIENYTSTFEIAIAVHGRERRGRRETAYVCASSRRRSIVQRADKYDSCAQPPRSRRPMNTCIFYLLEKCIKEYNRERKHISY